MGLLIPAYGDQDRKTLSSRLVLTIWQDPVSKGKTKSKNETDVDRCGGFSEGSAAVSTPNTPHSSEESKEGLAKMPMLPTFPGSSVHLWSLLEEREEAGVKSQGFESGSGTCAWG